MPTLVDSTEAAAEDDRVGTICERTWREQFATIEMSKISWISWLGCNAGRWRCALLSWLSAAQLANQHWLALREPALAIARLGEHRRSLWRRERPYLRDSHAADRYHQPPSRGL